jgi:hypothetical protein
VWLSAITIYLVLLLSLIVHIIVILNRAEFHPVPRRNHK